MRTNKTNELQTCGREHEIVSTAREVFSEYGYKKTTMDDVSARMNITRSALYYYYKNKDDLFYAIMENLIAEYRESVEVAVSTKKTTLEKLDVFCEYYLSYRNNFIKMFKFTDDDYFVNFQLYKRMKKMSIEIQNELITGIFKQDKKLSNINGIEYSGYLLTHSIRGFIFNPLMVDLKKLQEDISEMCRIFYRGLNK